MACFSWRRQRPAQWLPYATCKASGILAYSGHRRLSPRSLSRYAAVPFDAVFGVDAQMAGRTVDTNVGITPVLLVYVFLIHQFLGIVLGH